MVTPGDVQDRHIIAPLLAIARERFPSLKSAIADGGYQGKLTADEVQQQPASHSKLLSAPMSPRASTYYPSAGSLSARMAGSAVLFEHS